MADVTYSEVVRLAEQLTPQELKALIDHLEELARQRQLTKEERMALLDASILSVPVAEVPSARREDWYDDSGR